MHSDMVPDAIIATLLETIGKVLSQKTYDKIEKVAPGSRVCANDIARIIEEYGRNVIGVHSKDVSVVPLKDGDGWSVWANLNTIEEGRSDLVLITRIIKTSSPPFYKLFIDDLRVP